MNYWEQDDIDCTSWEIAMKAAFKRHAFTGDKQYVWAYRSDRTGRVVWTATDEAPSATWDESYP